MALVYLDASALVKLCVDEPGSELAAALWDGADVVATSRIADAEVRATLASGRRSGRLDPAAARRALDAWERLWPALRVVEVTAELADRAARLIARHPLRGGDALHLAAALTLRSPDLVVAVWDEHVAAAARAEHLRVVP
ncbi:VapC toxin family PIN domain ribonuclease [Cellulomonas sp. WB94]|uniref:type II toxin-antitoxin system VapC family toxin n=1 Tax=Cellulomonas sp. WB94 TaxID=2173174 RepID=UPI000D5689BE|nr:type II toxin-antitoxin system VapC family toxin [Cellulomonas sp. WB94]PVU82546.1 VapC toxin family PIN domain ribonuclease [Cellulomonas sp. WB94]